VSARGAPPTPLAGAIRVPGDKSISHRALILATLASGTSHITGLNPGGDVRATIRGLVGLGARLREDRANARVEVEGRGWEGLREPDDVIDAANSGTSLRTLLAVCSALPVRAVLTGDRTLRRRPMERVVVPLRAMGAEIDGRDGGRRAPLWVRGGRLRGVDWSARVASAQVKTALLLAGLRAAGETTVTEPGPSRDHTERMLAASGVEVRRTGRSVSLEGGQGLRAVDRPIPGDVSAAAFLLVAAALVPGSDLEVVDVGLNPTRLGGIETLAAMGADLRVLPGPEMAGEPAGRIAVRAGPLSATTVAGDAIPTLIDEIPVLAVAATQAHGETLFADAGELRVKESDRIAAMVAGLRALGAEVEPRPDGLVVRGPTPLRPATRCARGDHRVALALTVAGLVGGVEVRVRGWSCVRTSFPSWAEVLGAARGAQSAGGEAG